MTAIISQQPLQLRTDALEHCIRTRHSIRFYQEEIPVPLEILNECLALAQLAPSNSNIQNWRITFAQGCARDRIVSALKAEALQHEPTIPPLPDKFRPHRSAMGHTLYGEKGYNIKREEKDRHRAANMRNYEFFGAPMIGIITMDKGLTPVDAMSVGMFVQTLMLALTERHLGTCLQVSVTGYPDVVRKEFAIAEDQEILCGIALGWPAQDNQVNDLIMEREECSKSVTFLHE